MSDILTVTEQLFAAYPNSSSDEAAIVVYAKLLQDIPLDELQMAVDHCICTLKFLPGVSEIREAHHALTGGLIEQTPGEAWGSVEKALVQVGSWGTPRFRNPITARVVEMMGWRNLCASDKPGVDRAQFMQMYNQMAARSEEVEKMVPHVRGYFENKVRARLNAPVENGSGPTRLSAELKRLGLTE